MPCLSRMVKQYVRCATSVSVDFLLSDLSCKLTWRAIFCTPPQLIWCGLNRLSETNAWFGFPVVMTTISILLNYWGPYYHILSCFWEHIVLSYILSLWWDICVCVCIILVHVYMHVYTWRATIFFYIQTDNVTHVVILEGSENMDPFVRCSVVTVSVFNIFLLWGWGGRVFYFPFYGLSFWITTISFWTCVKHYLGILGIRFLPNAVRWFCMRLCIFSLNSCFSLATTWSFV